jgi:hypothetical protein
MNVGHFHNSKCIQLLIDAAALRKQVSITRFVLRGVCTCVGQRLAFAQPNAQCHLHHQL